MADEPIHDLTAAYALDALDAHDEERYEEHLATCERCREELAELRDPEPMYLRRPDAVAAHAPKRVS